MLVDGEVDLIAIIKDIRNDRVALVQHLNQYELVHQACLDFADRYDKKIKIIPAVKPAAVAGPPVPVCLYNFLVSNNDASLGQRLPSTEDRQLQYVYRHCQLDSYSVQPRPASTLDVQAPTPGMSSSPVPPENHALSNEAVDDEEEESNEAV